MSGVAALLRYSLPGVDDIEEDDIDINDLINQEAEEEKVDARKQKKPEWDEELLYKLLE